MEAYWSLRWIEQEGVRTLQGVLLRDNLARIEGLPLVARVSGAPSLEPGAIVRLEVGAIDLIERSLTGVYRATDEASQKA